MKDRESRWSVLIAARMRAGGAPKSIRIRNVSSRGLMIEVEPPPRRGTYVEIVRPDLTIIGQVVWSKDGRCGIHTRDRIDLRRLRSECVPVEPAGVASVQARSAPAIVSAELHEVSSALAKAVEFTVLAVSGGLAAITLGGAAYASLADTMATISAKL